LKYFNYLKMIPVFYYFNYFNYLILHRRQVVGPQRTTRTPPSAASARTISGRKRVLNSDDDDIEASADGFSEGGSLQEAGGGSPQTSDSAVKKRKVNKHGLVTLTNGVVSMRELALSIAVPSKCRDDGALTLFNATLSWGQAYALCTLVMCGKDHPVEKAKDMDTRMKIMYSAQPYSISDETLNEILEADPEQRLPYLHGMSKSAQQKLRYALYGQVGNLFNEKVFTKLEFNGLKW